MAKIESELIKKVIKTAKIVDVVGDFVKLRKKNVRYLGLCPFHDDRHIGNFVVYPKKNCYRCFACGERGGAVDFLMKHEGLTFLDAIRWLAKKYSIDIDMTGYQYTPAPPKPEPEPLPMLVLPMTMVTMRDVAPAITRKGLWQVGSEESKQMDAKQQAAMMEELDRVGGPLVRWIMTGVKWDVMARSRIAKMLTDYHVGLTKFRHTIWWQIDERGQVHTGKTMLYKDDGHRDREAQYGKDWIHSILFRHKSIPQYDEDRQEMKQTLFGMHLLNHYGKDATVCIVESEKTALLMAIAYGNHAKQVWMACGGLENISREKLMPIIAQGRKVVLYPDRDGIAKWKATAHQIGYDNLSVDTTPVVKWWLPKDGEKADIADVVIRIINESKPMRNMKQVRETMPKAERLIDEMGLTIENEGR